MIKLVQTILKNVSPQLREEIEKFVNSLEEKAKETKSPFDDIAVLLLRILVGL